MYFDGMSLRLDQALVSRNLCESRTEAQELIRDGHILVNNLITLKQTKQINEADEVVCLKGREFVSRGGNKLAGILKDLYEDEYKIETHISGKTALDVGASTGGFTDCLLRYGAVHVDAVDVGTSQIHSKLKNNPFVSIYENTNILTFNTANSYDIIVADLSFTKLSIVLKRLIELGNPSTLYLLLIKPQFEVGRGNTKKGIVRNQSLVDTVLDEYRSLGTSLGLASIKVSPCVIKGGDGNQEYFLTGTLH